MTDHCSITAYFKLIAAAECTYETPKFEWTESTGN